MAAPTITGLALTAPLYALACVPELWVVDVDARRVHVFADARDGSYASEVRAGPEGFLRPAALDIGALDVARLFAGL
jgi:Uma2 family endonuclease